MERTYTILLDSGARTAAGHCRAGSAFERPLELTSRLLAEPPRPAVHRERLTADELDELAQEPEFVAAAEIIRTKLHAPVNDGEECEAIGELPGRSRQSWGIAAIGADTSSFSGRGVTVAVLDTGIDARHVAFRGLNILEKDFTGLGNGDTDGHGTHCAGTFFGREVDGFRIGVACGISKALVGKIIGPQGGDSDMMIRGICWAHEQGARVISMSVGFDFAATVRQRVEEGWPGEVATGAALEAYRANLRLLENLLQMLRMQEALTGGTIVVSASGNDSRRGRDSDFVISACPPAGAAEIVTVGSLDPDKFGTGFRVSSFSNAGVGICAPGRRVLSAALGGGLKALSGTSLAASHVAGVAALWWEAVRQSELPANATIVRNKLIDSAQRNGFSPMVCAGERGAGRVCAPRQDPSVRSTRSANRLASDSDIACSSKVARTNDLRTWSHGPSARM